MPFLFLNQMRIVDADGLTVLLSVLQRHLPSLPASQPSILVLTNACFALDQLAVKPECKVRPMATVPTRVSCLNSFEFAIC
jgi:hypothetical protein